MSKWDSIRLSYSKKKKKVKDILWIGEIICKPGI